MARKQVRCPKCERWFNVVQASDWTEMPVHFYESAPFERCEGVGKTPKATRGKTD